MSNGRCGTCGYACIGTNINTPEWGWPYRCFYCEPWGGDRGDTGPKPIMAINADAIRKAFVSQQLKHNRPWWKRIFS